MTDAIKRFRLPAALVLLTYVVGRLIVGLLGAFAGPQGDIPLTARAWDSTVVFLDPVSAVFVALAVVLVIRVGPPAPAARLITAAAFVESVLLFVCGLAAEVGSALYRPQPPEGLEAMGPLPDETIPMLARVMHLLPGVFTLLLYLVLTLFVLALLRESGGVRKAQARSAEAVRSQPAAGPGEDPEPLVPAAGPTPLPRRTGGQSS